MATAPKGGHAALVDQLHERGLLDDTWRAIWQQVPREDFLPDTVWRQDPDRCVPVHGDERQALVHSDAPVITQLDDGRPDGPGIATCSQSQPSMVARMLQLLDVEDTSRVLEIGTGTGHLAALLAHRVGSERVFTVEVDQHLAYEAHKRLLAARVMPHVECGDGEAGLPAHAPYDRIVLTCAVRRVPGRLLNQLRPGGVLVAPLHRDWWSGALVRVQRRARFGVQGRFHGCATYMPMRSHRADATPTVDSRTARSSSTTLPTVEMLDLGWALYAGARLPGVRMWHTGPDDEPELWFQDAHSSAASVHAGEVWQYGPRSLWDETCRVWEEFQRMGTPTHHEFGLTYVQDGEELWWSTPREIIAPAPWTVPEDARTPVPGPQGHD